jgi:hypothetical protein
MEAKFGPLEKKDQKRLARIKKTFFIIAGCTLCGHKRYEKFLKDLKVESVDDKLRTYKSNWLRHVTRMKSSMMPTVIPNYKLRTYKSHWLRHVKRMNSSMMPTVIPNYKLHECLHYSCVFLLIPAAY